jgi:DNA-binding FadR family transcriptional regulator
MFLEFLGRYIPRQQVRVGAGTQEEQVLYLNKIKGEHQKIYEAILARDVSRSRASIRRHLANGLARLHKLDEIVPQSCSY